MLRKFKNTKLGMKSVAVLMLGSIVIGIGCDSKTTNKDEKFAEIFAAKVDQATQTFIMDASTGGTITGAKGVKLICDADAFLNANGNPVSGDVNVELVEALKVGDMLALNKQTVGNDNGELKLLKSGGQIFLNVTQNGEQLGVAEDKCDLKFPTDDFDASMGVFLGTEDDDGTLIWEDTGSKVALPSMVGGEGEFDSENYSFELPPSIYLELNNSSLGWINCDYFYSWTEATLTEISINLPEGYDADNTKVWAVFPSINNVTEIWNSENNVFQITNGYKVPVGIEIKLVALSISDDDTYSSAFSTVTVTQDMVTNLEFQPTTLEQFDTAAQDL